MTVIYRVSSFFLCLFLSLFSSGLKAQTDLNSFCFEDNVHLKSVERSIGFLLLPKDIVNLRDEDHCIDLVLSADRGKLFEKFLAGRYNLKRESSGRSGNGKNAEIQHCQLDLRTTVKQKSDSEILKIGEKNVLRKSDTSLSSTSTMEMILSPGVPGEMEATPEKLKVICRLVGADKANLQFSFADSTKGGVVSEFMVAKDEWLNIGSVIKDLNEKNRTVGIPQTEVSSTTGKSETQYDLKFK